MQLKQYLAAHGLTIDGFAQAIEESPFTVGKLIRGDRYPRPELAQKIRDHTEGHVTADDFLEAVLARKAETAARSDAA